MNLYVLDDEGLPIAPNGVLDFGVYKVDVADVTSFSGLSDE